MAGVTEVETRRLFAMWCPQCDYKTGEPAAFAEHLACEHGVSIRRAVTLTSVAESVAIARINAMLQELA